MPHRVFIALGSNLDDPQGKVRQGIAAISCLPLTRLAAQSSLYRTAAMGVGDGGTGDADHAGQPDFINAVAEAETRLAPRELLEALLAIEQRHGRKRTFPNAPRTLDLDLLLYGDEMIAEPGLTVPHPRMHERAFVLAPLAEIASGLVVPGRGAVEDLLRGVGSQRIAKLDR